MAATDQASSGTDVDTEIEVNPLAHLVAPIIAIGATMLVRKLMNDGYKRVSGGPVPDLRDPHTTISRALFWTAVTAATAAVVEVAVYRIANQIGERRVPR